MQLEKITLEGLLGELTELPADWMDNLARELVIRLKVSVAHLRALKRPVTSSDVADQLRESPTFLDVTRLFLVQGQETVAHTLCAELGASSMTWSRLRSIAKQEPERIARALDGIGATAIINEHLSRRWEVEDVLIDRYKMGGGRAISGQRRGRGLEDEVQTVLDTLGIVLPQWELRRRACEGDAVRV